MHKEVRKVDKKFFQTRGASENALFRKRNFLATDEDEVSTALVDAFGNAPRLLLVSTLLRLLLFSLAACIPGGRVRPFVHILACRCRPHQLLVTVTIWRTSSRLSTQPPGRSLPRSASHVLLPNCAGYPRRRKDLSYECSWKDSFLQEHQYWKQAPHYGAALKEKPRQYHYPKTRAPAGMLRERHCLHAQIQSTDVHALHRGFLRRRLVCRRAFSIMVY